MALFKVTFEMIEDNQVIGGDDIYVSHSSKEKALDCAIELAEMLRQGMARNIKVVFKTVEELPERTMLYSVVGEAIPTRPERLVTLVGEESILSN